MNKAMTKFEKEFFEEWSTDYDERRNKSFLEKSKTRIKWLAEKYIKDNETFLEIGVGTGESFELLSDKFKISYGMDISEGMVRKTFSKGRKNKKLFVGDSCNLPIKSDSVNFISCQDVIEHVPYQNKLISEMCRILKKDGIAIVTTPNPLWSVVLYLAEKFRLKVEEGEHEFIFLPKLVKKVIKDLDCTLVSDEPFVILPTKTSFDKIVEPLSKNKFLAKFGFDQMCIIRKNY